MALGKGFDAAPAAGVAAFDGDWGEIMPRGFLENFDKDTNSGQIAQPDDDPPVLDFVAAMIAPGEVLYEGAIVEYELVVVNNAPTPRNIRLDQ